MLSDTVCECEDTCLPPTDAHLRSRVTIVTSICLVLYVFSANQLRVVTYAGHSLEFYACSFQPCSCNGFIYMCVLQEDCVDRWVSTPLYDYMIRCSFFMQLFLQQVHPLSSSLGYVSNQLYFPSTGEAILKVPSQKYSYGLPFPSDILPPFPSPPVSISFRWPPWHLTLAGLQETCVSAS